MSETFSAGGAAFDVFKKREKGGVLLSATIAYLVLTFIVFGAFAYFGGAAVMQLIGAYGELMSVAMQGAPPPSNPNDPMMQNLMQAWMGVAPLYLLALLLIYILLAAYEAAVHRWLVRGEAGGGLLGLNLGADTWRVYLSYWLWLVVFTGLYLGIIILGAVIGAAAGFAFASGGGNESLMGLVALIVGVAAVGAFLYVLIRLAPATAVSVALKKFAFFKAWQVTRGRFWSMFGAYLILFLIYAVLAIAGYIVMAVIALGPMFAQAAQGGTPDPSVVMNSVTQPATLATLGLVYLLLVAVAMVMYVAFLGVSAKAVRVALADGKIAAPAA